MIQTPSVTAPKNPLDSPSVDDLCPSTSTESPAAAEAPDLRLLDLTPEFPEMDSFGVPHDLPDHAHVCPFPPDVDRFPQTYPDENLNLALSYVRLYLEDRDATDWFHVMVKSVAFESFLRTMEEDGGETCHTLLFACWCNGGGQRYPEARHRQHRHMIVASSNGERFEKVVWNQVQAADKPRRDFPCKRLKRIRSPLHLVNVIGYLSRRPSRCAFSFSDGHPSKLPLKKHHFHLHKTLPSSFLLPLVLLWDEGIAQLLYQERFQNASLARVIERPVVYLRGRWRQKYRDFYDFERGLVLPVQKGLRPTFDTPTPHAFCLGEGRKLYFEPCPEYEEMEPETWLKRQAEGGNRFYDVVEDAMWTPRPKYQKELNKLKPLLDRYKAGESEMRGLKRKYEELETRSREEIKRLKETCQTHQAEMEEMKAAMEELKEACRNKQGEVENLTEACRNQQAKVEELHAEVRRLHDNIHQLNDAEITRLRRKIQCLKAKIAQLERGQER